MKKNCIRDKLTIDSDSQLNGSRQAAISFVMKSSSSSLGRLLGGDGVVILAAKRLTLERGKGKEREFTSSSPFRNQAKVRAKKEKIRKQKEIKREDSSDNSPRTTSGSESMIRMNDNCHNCDDA